MEPTFIEKYVAPYWKAVVAFVTPGATLLLNSAMNASSDGGTVVTGNEWFAAALTCVVTAGAVWAVRNAPKPVPTPPEGEVL